MENKKIKIQFYKELSPVSIKKNIFRKIYKTINRK